MVKETLTFNDLPQVVAELRDEVVGMKVVLLDLQKGQTKQKMERVRRTMNVEEAADYLGGGCGLLAYASQHPLHEVAEGRGAWIEARQALGIVQ